MIGLNAKFTSVVGYFLVANLTAEQQTTLCLHVISEVEKLGIEILHVSTDSHATNTKKFRMLKKIFWPYLDANDDTLLDELVHWIRHPNDGSRPLFLSFDACHIIKNIRNCFIDRPLAINGMIIDFGLCILLYTGSKKCYYGHSEVVFFY